MDKELLNTAIAVLRGEHPISFLEELVEIDLEEIHLTTEYWYTYYGRPGGLTKEEFEAANTIYCIKRQIMEQSNKNFD